MASSTALDLSMRLGALLQERGQTIATAESCTGGMLATLLTDVAGSSRYYLGGVTAYANEAKTALLGVDAAMLASEGAVSAVVAMAMAQGARDRLNADHAVSVTGIAGPGGGSEEKPVGLVFVGFAAADGTWSSAHRFAGDRSAVRESASRAALTAAIRHVASRPIA